MTDNCFKVYTPQVWQDQPRQKTEAASLTNETKKVSEKHEVAKPPSVFHEVFFVEFGVKPPKFFLLRLILPHEVSINT